MKFTRNTKLYKASDGKSVNVVYRTLTVTELKVLENVTNQFNKCELAYDIAYISGNEPNFFAKHQIGKDIIDASMVELNNDTLFELIIEDFRASTKNDLVISIILSIVELFPATSIEYLFNLTIKDLLELGVLCENVTNKKLFNVGNVQKTKLKNNNGKAFFDDDGKSLQDKMKEMRDF